MEMPIEDPTSTESKNVVNQTPVHEDLKEVEKSLN